MNEITPTKWNPSDKWNPSEFDTSTSITTSNSLYATVFELTWKDIQEIDEWISVIQTSDNLTGKQLYEEVLKQFTKSKQQR